MNNREIRGYSILAQGITPKCVDQDTYLIPSQSSNRKYLVRNAGFEWTCECPDNQKRGIECKHIHAIKFWLALKDKIASKKFFETQTDYRIPSCIYCNSVNIVKNGKRKGKHVNKQRYKCKDCNKTFVQQKEFNKLKGNPKIITLVLDLYFKGVSLRKIVDHLKQFYDIRISRMTVYRWIKKFTKIMNKYVNKLGPKLSGHLQADEQMINSKGKWVWSWNVLDEETRFLIANHVSKDRRIEDAREVFSKAKKVMCEKPESITTDGLWSYEKAIKKEFLSRRIPRTEHIRLAGISKKTNNNKVERLHGTFRERDKVMRGFKGIHTAQALLNGFRTYYNFIRPHQALNGNTPAEVAGINLELNGGNRWYELLNRAINENYDGLPLVKPLVLVKRQERKKKRKKRKSKRRIAKEPIKRYIIRIFSDDEEVIPSENIKTRFNSYETALEFAHFYKDLFPNHTFVIFEAHIFDKQIDSEYYKLKEITRI